MLKVKLSRIGKRNQPQYRIVVVEARSKNKGGHDIDLLGHYNPLTETNSFQVDKERFQQWLKKGAHPTQTVRKLIIKYTAWNNYLNTLSPILSIIPKL